MAREPGKLEQGPGAPAGGGPGGLSARQADALGLVRRYYELSEELPSSGWLARRMTISSARARQHLDVLRRRGWLDRARLEKP